MHIFHCATHVNGLIVIDPRPIRTSRTNTFLRFLVALQNIIQISFRSYVPPYLIHSYLTEQCFKQVLEFVESTEDRRFIRLLISQIADSHGIMPRELYIQPVERTSEYPVYCGAYGWVYRGQYSGKDVALKWIRIYDTDYTSIKRETEKSLRYEALTWRNLKHRHILPCLGITTFGTLPTPRYYIVSPWMPHGSIRQLLRSRSSLDLNWRVWIPKWSLEIASGLQYLHEEGIVHGDLPGANILVDSDYSVRLADFGFAVLVDGTSGARGSNRGGNPRWLAPELLEPDATSVRPTLSSDIFSLGCVIVEIYTDQDPYIGLSTMKVVFMIPRGTKPSKERTMSSALIPLTDHLWTLCEACWSKDPSRRPSAKESVLRLRMLMSYDAASLPINSTDV
ncbi:unnamed protein product [Somion occarium]|uniref:Protein kinase domain-containing protein n=1 Tax=Somion occarium TaxID=3059160 RepID=A0ABP1E8Q2_9APHY